MPGELERLQQWYASQCDGNWEHQHGIQFGTLDNPGWSLDIDLSQTALAGTALPRTAIERGEKDWVFCDADGVTFRGRCGPANLVEMLSRFLEFAESDNGASRPANSN